MKAFDGQIHRWACENRDSPGRHAMLLYPRSIDADNSIETLKMGDLDEENCPAGGACDGGGHAGSRCEEEIEEGAVEIGPGGLTVGDGRSCGLKCQIGSPRNAIRQPWR